MSEIAVSEIEAFFGQYRPGLKLPDGWFGRPFDDQHQLTAVQETDDGLLVELDGRLRMLLRGPVGVAVEAGRRLVLTGSTSLSLGASGLRLLRAGPPKRSTVPARSS